MDTENDHSEGPHACPDCGSTAGPWVVDGRCEDCAGGGAQ